jgi:hypothetical protein
MKLRRDNYLTAEVIRGLYSEELRAENVCYDSNQIEYYQFRSAASGHTISLQLNSARRCRPENPPTQEECPICFPAIIQKGKQRYIVINLHEREMAVLANPFGYMPTGITIASTRHESQSWRAVSPYETYIRIQRTVGDLAEIASMLPGFVITWNGCQAGASLPEHQHYQAFELPSGHGPLAIQQAAAKHLAMRSSAIIQIGIENDYPILAFRITDSQDSLIPSVTGLIQKWENIQGEAATANLIALTEDGEAALYFVPRNRLFQRAPGFAGLVGALEVSGSFVCSAEWEIKACREGRFSYDHFWRVLESVRPQAACQLYQ